MTNTILERTKQRLLSESQTELAKASTTQLHNALAGAVLESISDNWLESRRRHEQKRRAYYFSAEYLTGRLVFNNLYNLGILMEVRESFKQQGVDIGRLEDIEDAALGNGGLGRLAACFLDSAATHHIPLDGYGLRYKLGLFRQTFSKGMQREAPDDWQRGGDPWSIRRDDKAVTVEFADGAVMAVPYDMPVIGYQSKNICTLRLWQSEPLEELDFALFNIQQYDDALRGKNRAEDITRVLYPNDSTDAGKRLRIRQQYLLSSASLQDIVRRYRRVFGDDFSDFAGHCAIALNDTHPTLSIPELIRLLMEQGLSFDNAFDIARQTFCYTNHTVMGEALERWDLRLLESEIPHVTGIIARIDEKLAVELSVRGICDNAHMRIVDECGCVHMARLAVYVASYVNGVARIHSQILKDDIFKDWYALWPEKFRNVTNGITQRRWLGLSNPELSERIEAKIGDGFLKDLDELEALKDHISDDYIHAFHDIKHAKKKQLADIIKAREGVDIPPNFIFDVQVKRLHEYKRQLLCAFSIMDIYFALKDGRLPEFSPTAFIFGAKAAPGYLRAKAIMRYINAIAALVNADSDVSDKLRVVFVQNYNCSYAEHIIPAADFSEQISTAGTEASGTGNMKLMLNGAVTLGTYDGANIEIAEQAGEENNYIFGARVEDIARIRPTYDPKAIYESDARLKRVVDTLIDGTFSDGGDGAFPDLHAALLSGMDWHAPDHYYLLLDMLPYFEAKLQANRDYADKLMFGRKCLANIASAGKFSSDRTVAEYAREIWRLEQSV